jgi:hypothetical protein
MSRVVSINGPAIGVAPRSEAGSTLNGAAGSTGKPARRSVFPGKPCKDAVPVRSAIARSRTRKEPVTDTVHEIPPQIVWDEPEPPHRPRGHQAGDLEAHQADPLVPPLHVLLVGYVDGPNVGERHVDPAT